MLLLSQEEFSLRSAESNCIFLRVHFPASITYLHRTHHFVHFRTCTRTTVGGPCWSAFGQGGWVPCINRSFPANSRPSSVSRSHMPATRSHHPLAPTGHTWGQKVRQQSRCPRRAGSTARIDRASSTYPARLSLTCPTFPATNWWRLFLRASPTSLAH